MNVLFRMVLRFCITIGALLGACQQVEPPGPASDSRGGGRDELVLSKTSPELKSENAPALPSEVEEPQQDAHLQESSRVWGRADKDPSNDSVVAPPDPVPDCEGRLRDLGVEFRAAALPLKQYQGDIPTCGSHDAVTLVKAPGGMSFRPPATVTCQLALALVEVETLIQSIAQEQLGKSVRSLHQGGTYSCRKMARFNLVSEHSYGNAIDVFAFTLEDGSKVSVVSDYGKTTESPTTHKAKFLRSLASAAYDEGLVSVSLTPFWDALHRDHFHFDMARYRVDGTR